MWPWLIWTVLVALISVSLFVAIRGRAGRDLLPIGLAAWAGTAAGNALGGVIGLDVAVFGEFHLLAALIGAALAMAAAAALLALLAPRSGTR